MKVHIFESANWPEAETAGLTKEKIQQEIERAWQSVSTLLPVSPYVNFIVRPHFFWIIPEYGVGAYAHDAESIEIVFDKAVPHGVSKTLESIYQTVFHEVNHAARYNTTEFDPSFMNYVVTEGLATAFERDTAKYEPLYGEYEDDDTMQLWLAELKAGDWDKKEELFFDNPDGRRWIGYKTGTWLVDRALQKSGKSIVELTSMPCNQVVQLAEVA